MTQEVTTTHPVQIRVLEDLKEANRLPALVSAVESVKAADAIKAAVADKFIDQFTAIEQLVAGALDFVVQDETETGKMFEAGQKVALLKKVKKALDKTHEDNKQDSLRTVQAYDAVKRAGYALLEPAIRHYEAQENYIVNREAKRIEALRVERCNQIMPYLHPGNIATPYPDWGTMHEEDFAATLALAVTKENEIEQARVAKIIREAKDREELERLRKEAAAKDAELAAARQAQAEAEQAARDAKFIGIQEERLAAFAIKQKEEQEANAARQLEQAPDRDKIRAYVAALQAVPFPVLQDEAVKVIGTNVTLLLHKIGNYVNEKLQAI